MSGNIKIMGAGGSILRAIRSPNLSNKARVYIINNISPEMEGTSEEYQDLVFIPSNILDYIAQDEQSDLHVSKNDIAVLKLISNDIAWIVFSSDDEIASSVHDPQYVLPIDLQEEIFYVPKKRELKGFLDKALSTDTVSDYTAKSTFLEALDLNAMLIGVDFDIRALKFLRTTDNASFIVYNEDDRGSNKITAIIDGPLKGSSADNVMLGYILTLMALKNLSDNNRDYLVKYNSLKRDTLDVLQGKILSARDCGMGKALKEYSDFKDLLSIL